MLDGQKDITINEIMQDDDLSLEILDIAGHYTFNDAMVKKEIHTLYANLAANNIDGKRFVIDHIKRPIRNYSECYNLKGATTRIKQLAK